MDSAFRTLLYYEWKSFARNKFQLLMLAIFLLFGIYAIYSGQAEVNAQREIIQSVSQLEQEEFFEYQSSFNQKTRSPEEEQVHDIASRPDFAWFRHGYHAIIYPHDYAALAIGQRDLFRYYYRLTGMSLHYQLFENELANPLNLMIGNFDLSFVLVYIFPLLIIAFCYGLFSSEKENGTLALLQIQPISIRMIILVRLGFYFSILTGLALLISLLGLVALGNPFASENFLPAIAWITGVIAYAAFWFALLFLIISFRRNSSFNAITSIACWLLFLIIFPALLNIIATTKYPLNSAELAGLTRRTGLEDESDEEASRAVILDYLANKPELQGSDTLIMNNMMAKAYAAFTSLKDINNQQIVDEYNTQVAKRNNWTSLYYGLSPAVNLQDIMTHITETDLHTFLNFQYALAAFHEEITDFYFTKLFWDKPILLEDYSERPTFEMPATKNRWKNIWQGIAKILVVTGLTFLFGFFRITTKV